MSRIELRRGFVALMGFAALWICSSVHAAQVRAWLDRNTMQLGETVTLNVEVSDDSNAAQPDFSALQADFNLLGTQSSTAMNIVNGQASSKLLWAVDLEPKHSGAITIPALSVAGTQTQPINLVVQPGSGSGGKAGDDVFLEVGVEPRSPYVQQQVRVTVKLFYVPNLTDGNLEDPHGDGVNARKLGQDASYTAEVDGHRYKVLERHYALAAEKSGALALAPVTFRGHALNPNDLNSFFSRGRAVTAQAPALTLDVRARPPASGSDAWLPAQSLDLAAEGIDASTQARVGEPLTLTLRLKAQGLGFEQLPELKLPKIDGADIYQDKETTQNRDDGAWQFGERERKFAIVPNRPGMLAIPALSLAWWDTAHDRAASAELPARTLSVAVGAGADARGADAKKATSTPTPGNVAAPASSAPAASNSADAGSDWWRLLAVAALGLWLVTLAAWIYMARRDGAARSPPHDGADAAVVDEASIRAARKAFADACARDDASACARTLLAWARVRGVSVRTLGELAQRVTDASQRDALLGFERTLYGAQCGAATSTAGVGAQLAQAFNQDISLPATAHSVRTQSSLPPHYPFVVRKDGTTGR